MGELYTVKGSRHSAQAVALAPHQRASTRAVLPYYLAVGSPSA
jgi:hypothetical protein